MSHRVPFLVRWPGPCGEGVQAFRHSGEQTGRPAITETSCENLRRVRTGWPRPRAGTAGAALGGRGDRGSDTAEPGSAFGGCALPGTGVAAATRTEPRGVVTPSAVTEC
ncbi:hypothetical protein ATKI12_6686 [Kitasatospora sp. Ki12]